MSIWDIIAYISVGIVALGILVSLIGSGPDYKIDGPVDGDIESDDFRWMMEALTDAKLNTDSKVQVLANGEKFYPAELEAIRSAQRSINLEAYIFSKGRVTGEMIDTLAERARAGVKVNVVIDAVGSFATRMSYFQPLIAAGGKVHRYNPLSIKSFFRMNNRTHRELLIVDGRIGFLGGAGIADHWMYQEKKGHPRWRDTMVRVEGDVVSSLQATFSENWCEAAGEILTGPEYWPGDENAGNTCAMVINGAPNAAAFTRARVLFQCLMASAKKSIDITTPYFLPDASMRGELVKAIRERGVRVRIVVPGNKSDHALTRTSSRLLYGEVLKAGAEIYEYQRSMIHAKILIADGLWSVVGSTNCDPRSFGLNDEVNMAMISGDVARQLTDDFESDIGQSRQISYEEWKSRGLRERLMETAGWLIRKQQ
jgi:cardiolipin synthase A/B